MSGKLIWQKSKHLGKLESPFSHTPLTICLERTAGRSCAMRRIFVAAQANRYAAESFMGLSLKGIFGNPQRKTNVNLRKVSSLQT